MTTDDNTTEKENAAAAASIIKDNDEVSTSKTIAQEKAEAHQALTELLQNGLFIFKKTQFFTPDEVIDMARWIVNAQFARAGKA